MPAALLLALLAAAGPAVSVAPAEARPGDAVLVRVAGAGEAPVGTLAGRPLLFWREGAEWRALGALPVETAPGPATAAVEAGGARAEATLGVVAPGFASKSLTLAAKYVEEPVDRKLRRRIRADRAAFDRAWDQPPAAPRFLSGFAWPRASRVTGRFGDQRVLNGKKESVHYGVDLTGPRGAPIAAAADGEVVLARNAYYSGKTVVLWHGAGVFTLYFHLDRVDVRPGAQVKRGQRIGLLGATGRATGPHLHWSARVGGLYVDPESLLEIDFAAGTAPPRRTREAAASAPAPTGATPPEEPAPTAPAAEPTR
ncbi:MAG TPA: M23 family metallopeptidase [Anaeromyxobacter sp.]|nr:M23 family metallopeptidase [Anaeromyxobacter sp.]